MRVGFVINSRVPELSALGRGMSPVALFRGWDDRGSPMSFMRFRWIGEALQRTGAAEYLLYRPGLNCDAVVFLKSMGPQCDALARRLRSRGVRVIFEANVDYYTEFSGVAAMDAMAPTAEQRARAISMTENADAVIASSRHLAGVCEKFNPRTAWVPDNVDLRFVPPRVQVEPVRDGRLQVWWSGMAAKLFEFLAAEEALLAVRDRIHLHLVMDTLTAMQRWRPDVREKVERFLARVPHTVHLFSSIPDLLGLYARGGVIVSPRTLDTPYNLAHSEWKLTLGMACELPALASPVPSYVDAASTGNPGAVTICQNNDEWLAAFDGWLSRPADVLTAGRDARTVVVENYSTDVVAPRHLAAIGEPKSAGEPA